MNKDWVLSQESFDSLLAWLSPQREDAGRKYENIRLRLIKMFACRGCCDAEDLADETINRVAKRLGDIKDNFHGEPALYFYGVSKKVYLEYLRRKPAPPPPVPEDKPIEREYECLENCVQKLTPNNRRLVLDYYQEEKRAKIDHRKQLAAHLGIALNALRIRAHRVRATLQQCVKTCIQEGA